MSEQSHTPWTAEWCEEGADWVVMGCVYAPDADGIAWQPNICTLSDSVGEDVARLIAAAPELLEALERLCIQMNNLIMVCDVPERFSEAFNDGQRQAEAAISKATGASNEGRD